MDNGWKRILFRKVDCVVMYVTAILMGLAGGLHCVGMCGPLVLAATSKYPFVGAKLIYNLGRVITYGLFGLLVFVEIFGFYYATHSNVDFMIALQTLWNKDTQIIWASIVSFWFGTQAFKK